jgi:hypothetical protein
VVPGSWAILAYRLASKTTHRSNVGSIDVPAAQGAGSPALRN